MPPKSVILDDVQNPRSCLHEAAHSPAREFPPAPKVVNPPRSPQYLLSPTPTTTYAKKKSGMAVTVNLLELKE